MEKCVRLPAGKKKQKKKRVDLLPLASPLLQLGIARAAINFHANHRGLGMNSGTVFQLCVHVRVCPRFVSALSLLQELAETKHHLHAAGCPDCLLLALGQRRGFLRALL